MDTYTKDNLLDRFGTSPNETGQKKRIRIHQGWWRMNILNEPPGKHPKKDNDNVCNTILNGEQTKKNFLTDNSYKAVIQTLDERKNEGTGIMEEDRLFNNLLSSQPLCFNFFGELMADTEFGLQVLQTWWPDLTELKRVIFEFAPKERFTNDNSAFDIAFEVTIGDKSGLIGLECKYTDTFSSTEYDKPAYKEIFEKSRSFSANYESLKASRYNQLFRNQLIAEGLIQNNKYDFVRTGLFCYEQDSSAIETGQELQQMLSKPDSFQIITYRNFIENVQQLSLDWQKREWTMLLWARYCGTVLSEPIYQELQKLIVLHSDNQNNDTQFFKLAIELERQFQDELIKNEIHFRASLNSLSLISVGTDKPELGVPCKNHNQWTAEILRTYIEKIKSKPAPKRPTPEKSLQAWIIKEAQANDHKLPFDNSIKFITSELAMHNYSGDKVVSDIIGYDTSTNQLIIIELKSDRLLKRLIEQVDSFGEIIHDNFWFFHDLVTLHGFGKLEEVTRKAIVWPHEKTSPLEKLKELDIAEYTYQESNGSYNFIDHSKNETHRFAHLTKFDIEADFITFREQIAEEFGKPNLEQTMLFFERAVAQANKDLMHSAIADAQTAYTFAQFNDEYRIVYLIGFLSQLHIDTEDFKKARAYCELGYKMLDTDDTDYADDKAKFDELKEIIDSESWKDDLNKNE